jgi:glycosyltransferase involved in cell wall biosynthesis
VKILWLNWKDRDHPSAGGAEVVLWELAQRMINAGHQVTLLTCGYTGSNSHEIVDGINVIRVGTNRLVHPFLALAHYARHMRNKFDIVIEVVNTAPYFGVFFGRNAKRFLFYHQLAREVWFHEMKAPFSQLGFHIFEPVATRMLARANVPTITVSESTRQDLARYDFKADRTHIIPQGIQLQPIKSLSDITKFDRPTILSFGAMRAMKRTLDQIIAFELAKKSMPELQMKIAGSSNDPYGQKVLEYIENSPYRDDIEYLGRVGSDTKISLMQHSHITLQTALKEGWGLTVTEAASQGTPAVVYDVDGLRDSVRHWETGIITSPNPEALSKGILALLGDSQTYKRLQKAGWQWSRQLNFDNSYKSLANILEIA